MHLNRLAIAANLNLQQMRSSELQIIQENFFHSADCILTFSGAYYIFFYMIKTFKKIETLVSQNQ